MNPSFQDNRRVYDQIIGEMALLENSYVIVGFIEGSTTHDEVKDKRLKKGRKSLPQIAADNEFGTVNIPARPFMSTSFDENRQQINRIIERQYDRIVTGQSTVQKSLNLIGLYMKDLIQKKILSIYIPPNSPRTIAAKKSSKPLIDFGQMLAGVQWQAVIE